MKVLLINPQFSGWILNKEFTLPISLFYLAGSLKASQHEPAILDLNIYRPWEKGSEAEEFCLSIIEKQISAFSPNLIGIGCLFSGSFTVVLHSANRIRQKFPHLPIVIGGIHPTLYYTEILRHCDSVDYIVLGEGEKTLVNLVNVLVTSSIPTSDNLSQIPGLAWKYNGMPVANPRGIAPENLDEIPFPAYDLMKITDYYHNTSGWFNPKNLPINTTIPLLTSRSCPFPCTFCVSYNVMGRGFRARTPKHVVDEIEYFYDVHNHRHFSVIDDNFTLKKSRVMAICDEIRRRNLNIQFECTNGLYCGTIDQELLDAMVDAGCVRIGLAIESGSDLIRNQSIRKNLARHKIYNAIAATKKHRARLYVKAFFIIGMPEETQSTLQETYDMINEIDIDEPVVNNIVPFPGTALFERSCKEGLWLDKVNLKDIWKMESFIVQNKSFYIKPYQLSIEELAEFRVKVDELVQTMANRNLAGKGMIHYHYRKKE